jgi:S1-C subfamily serine protease
MMYEKEKIMATSNVNLLEGVSAQLAAATEKAAPCVVTVHGRRRFPSSGVHWQKGVIVTANHTVRRDEGITVTFAGGRDAPATLTGRDATTDLAVLKIENAEAGMPEFADSTSLLVGNLALAVGRVDSVPRASLALIGLLGGSWRSWYGGEIDQLIRLDRELHPTLSGGPLVDVYGRVLGINTSGLSRIVGITVPVVTMNRVVKALLAKGHIGRGYLGLGLYSVPLPQAAQGSKTGATGELSDGNCLIVLNVEADGPAAKSGVLVGDLIVALEGAPIRDTEDVQRALGPERVGKGVKASILRGGNPIELSITVGERPRLQS